MFSRSDVYHVHHFNHTHRALELCLNSVRHPSKAAFEEEYVTAAQQGCPISKAPLNATNKCGDFPGCEGSSRLHPIQKFIVRWWQIFFFQEENYGWHPQQNINLGEHF